MELILIVLILMTAILLWVWLLRVYGELSRFREEVKRSWVQLCEAVFCRREIMPYLIASISFQEREAVEAIGNACDLAAQATGIEEQAKAESRLNAALAKLLRLIEDHPEVKAELNFQRLCRELEALDKRIEFLAEVYNKQVLAYNVKLENASTRLLSLFVSLRKETAFSWESVGIKPFTRS